MISISTVSIGLACKTECSVSNITMLFAMPPGSFRELIWTISLALVLGWGCIRVGVLCWTCALLIKVPVPCVSFKQPLTYSINLIQRKFLWSQCLRQELRCKTTGLHFICQWLNKWKRCPIWGFEGYNVLLKYGTKRLTFVVLFNKYLTLQDNLSGIKSKHMKVQRCTSEQD